MGSVWFGRAALLVVLAFALLIAACSSGPAVVCNKPYIIHGRECCLDSNNNSICDVDEGLLLSNNATTACSKTDCSLCPAEIVEKKVEVPVTHYICEKDGKEVTDPADCRGNKAFNPFERYRPYTGDENRSVLELFTLRPACRDSKHALELHYKAGSAPANLSVQVKESPTAAWRDIFSLSSPPLEKYLYGAFCNGVCTSNVQWFLAPGKVYLLRVKFDYWTLYGNYQHSNEYIVDAREDGPYLKKLC